jgi:hypothetical protein
MNQLKKSKEKLMKKLFITLLTMFGMSCVNAAGPLDGIYSCNVSLLGTNYPSYVTVNGHPDGGTIYAVAAVSQTQNFYGYGIGQASSTSFVGSTMYGYPFNFTANTIAGTLNGSIGILWGSSVVNATTSCAKLW